MYYTTHAAHLPPPNPFCFGPLYGQDGIIDTFDLPTRLICVLATHAGKKYQDQEETLVWMANVATPPPPPPLHE